MEVSEAIKTDFNYELSVNKFPFQELIEGNEGFLAALLIEYAQLTPRPKLHLYFKEFISDDEWSKAVTEKFSVNTTGSTIDSFIPLSNTQIKARRIIEEFSELIAKNSVEEKYFGRFISDAESVRILKSIDEQLRAFKNYVFNDRNLDNYPTFAKAAAKKIILMTGKIRIPGLPIALLKDIEEISIDTDITLSILLNKITDGEQRELRQKFTILKTIADEFINDEISKIKTNTIVVTELPSGYKELQPLNAPTITIPDRILRELDIIFTIFKAQHSRYDPENANPYPMILGRDGCDGINGQYIQHMDILSDVELLNVQEFKKHITSRFENASNHTLINSELLKIKAKAQIAIDYYNENLTSKNSIVKDFLIEQQRPIAERINSLNKYAAVVTVGNYYVDSVYFGADRGSMNQNSSHISNRPYWYWAYNFFLATVCQQVVDFIDNFKLDPQNEDLSSAANPSIFTTIFSEGINEQDCLNILKSVNPPVTDQNGYFILGDRKKSAVVAWHDVLEKKGKFKNNIPPERRVQLINQLIPGLKISSRSFRNIKGVYTKYYACFSSLAEKI